MFCLRYKNFIEDTPISSQTQLSVIPLPFHINRFIQEGGRTRKDSTIVMPPLRMKVPFVQEGRDKEFHRTYVLRSIVTHLGPNIGGGHYVTYIPDPTEVNAEGIPTHWARASDGSPKQRCAWKQVGQEIALNGYIFMYDLEPEPAADPS